MRNIAALLPEDKNGVALLWLTPGVVKMLPMFSKVDPIFIPLHFVND